MRRWLLPFLSLALACGQEPDLRPNVLFVTIDTTRADRLGCYGYGKDTSPNIDVLAAQGVRFEQALSTSAVTPISHASMFTGMNPNRHGMRIFAGSPPDRLGPDAPLLAEGFRDAGWSTAAFVSAYTASEQFGLDRGFEDFDANFAGAGSGVGEEEAGGFPKQRAAYGLFWLDRRAVRVQRRADATTDRVLAWLSEHDERFFMWVHYFDPHDPWLVPPDEILRAFGAARDAPDAKLAVYDPEIFFMDRELGRLLDALRADGRLDQTIVVIVSDHGQGLGEHDWFLHGVLYQEQLRAPLILRGPGLPAGRTIPDLVRTIDLFPTLAELAGLAIPQGLQGRSLMPLVRGESDPPRIGYAEALNTLEPIPAALPAAQRDLLFAVVDWPWKLIHHRARPQQSELFQLERDPQELKNLAEQQPSQRARLLGEIERSGMLTIERAGADSPSTEVQEKLRALGYVE